jgi:SAM-dependent methyltransferase
MIKYALRCLPRTAGITFVDLGSGKGRVLFVAAELPFHRIIGVEFARQLHEAALRNVASYSNPKQECFDITPVLGDASKFPIPEESCLVYLYTPFKGPLLREVLACIASSYTRSPRPMYLVYGHQIDYHLRMFDSVPGFAPISPRGRRRSALAPRRTDVHVYGTRETIDP